MSENDADVRLVKSRSPSVMASSVDVVKPSICMAMFVYSPVHFFSPRVMPSA